MTTYFRTGDASWVELVEGLFDVVFVDEYHLTLEATNREALTVRTPELMKVLVK